MFSIELTHDLNMALPLLVGPRVVAAHPDEPLRVVVYRMAETGHTRLPEESAFERRPGS